MQTLSLDPGSTPVDQFKPSLQAPSPPPPVQLSVQLWAWTGIAVPAKTIVSTANPRTAINDRCALGSCFSRPCFIEVWFVEISFIEVPLKVRVNPCRN